MLRWYSYASIRKNFPNFGLCETLPLLSLQVWQALLAVRSLVLPPSQDIATWLKFASLCRKSGRVSQSQATLVKLLQYDPAQEAGGRLLSRAARHAGVPEAPVVPWGRPQPDGCIPADAGGQPAGAGKSGVPGVAVCCCLGRSSSRTWTCGSWRRQCLLMRIRTRCRASDLPPHNLISTLPKGGVTTSPIIFRLASPIFCL